MRLNYEYDGRRHRTTTPLSLRIAFDLDGVLADMSDVTAGEIERAPETVRALHEELAALNGVNVELGYQALSIYAPREVTTHERDETDSSS